MRRDYLEIARSGVDDILQQIRSDSVSKYRECQQLLCKTIDEIMQDLQGKPFRDKAEEICFYKEDAPHIWGLYLFYAELIKMEAARIYESPETFRLRLEARLEEVATYFKDHHCLCAYYYEGRTNKDERLFTRRGSHNGKDPVIDIRIDRDFTRGAKWLSMMRRNELLRTWLTGQIRTDPVGGPQRKLKFHGTQTALIELLKAMHFKGDFGDVTFEDVIEWGSEAFRKEINNHNNALDNMKARKKDITPYLADLSIAFRDYSEGKKPSTSENKSYLS